MAPDGSVCGARRRRLVDAVAYVRRAVPAGDVERCEIRDRHIAAAATRERAVEGDDERYDPRVALRDLNRLPGGGPIVRRTGAVHHPTVVHPLILLTSLDARDDREAVDRVGRVGTGFPGVDLDGDRAPVRDLSAEVPGSAVDRAGVAARVAELEELRRVVRGRGDVQIPEHADAHTEVDRCARQRVRDATW